MLQDYHCTILDNVFLAQEKIDWASTNGAPQIKLCEGLQQGRLGVFVNGYANDGIGKRIHDEGEATISGC